jgi:hypothetical protein
MDNKENVSFNIVKQNEPTATAKSFKTNSPVKKNRQIDNNTKCFISVNSYNFIININPHSNGYLYQNDNENCCFLATWLTHLPVGVEWSLLND